MVFETLNLSRKPTNVEPGMKDAIISTKFQAFAHEGSKFCKYKEKC